MSIIGNDGRGRTFVIKASKDLSGTSSDDLRRLAVTATGDEQTEALAELGRRSLAGEPKQQPQSPVGQQSAVTDLQPQPAADAGTPADPRAVAKQLHDDVERGFAKAAQDRIEQAVRSGASPAAIELVKAQAAAQAALQIRRHRVAKRTAHGEGQQDHAPYSGVRSSDAQARSSGLTPSRQNLGTVPISKGRGLFPPSTVRSLLDK